MQSVSVNQSTMRQPRLIAGQRRAASVVINATKLYKADPSQPARSVAILVKTCGMPVEMVDIDVFKMEHKTPEYLAKFPTGLVPALEDDGLTMTESAAMMSYLASKYEVPEHWYPRTDLKAKAKVDEALHWHHGGLRKGCMGYLFNKVFAGLFKMEGNDEVAEASRGTMLNALDQLENSFLKENPFIAGKEISIADLLCSCEIEQLCVCDEAKLGLSMETVLSDKPKVKAWLKRVAEKCAPHYDEVHTTIRSIGK